MSRQEEKDVESVSFFDSMFSKRTCDKYLFIYLINDSKTRVVWLLKIISRRLSGRHWFVNSISFFALCNSVTALKTLSELCPGVYKRRKFDQEDSSQFYNKNNSQNRYRAIDTHQKSPFFSQQSSKSSFLLLLLAYQSVKQNSQYTVLHLVHTNRQKY